MEFRGGFTPDALERRGFRINYARSGGRRTYRIPLAPSVRGVGWGGKGKEFTAPPPSVCARKRVTFGNATIVVKTKTDKIAGLACSVAVSRDGVAFSRFGVVLLIIAIITAINCRRRGKTFGADYDGGHRGHECEI